jgi:hypothetical protein
MAERRVISRPALPDPDRTGGGIEMNFPTSCQCIEVFLLKV